MATVAPIRTQTEEGTGATPPGVVPGPTRSGRSGPTVRARVEGSASLLDEVLASRSRTRTARVLGGERSCWVTVAPGVVQIRSGVVEGWEPDDEWVRPDDQGQLFDDRSLDERGVSAGGEKLPIAEWSPKSRRNMIRTMASLDWTPFVEAASGYRPGLVTLTYPGDWEAVAPDGATVKRHLQAFRKALGRNVCDPVGAWKLEFQRRGAPHLHLWLLLPVGKVQGMTLGQWVSATWARIVGADGDERARHEAAGTQVDFGWSSKCTDPQRIVTYFSKHNAPSSTSSKEYQHRVPESWTEPGRGPGRYWGVWSLERCAVEVEVDRGDAVELVRLLRSWVRSQNRAYKRSVRRVDHTTGEIYYRRAARRHVVRALSRSEPGGWVLAGDGPALMAQLSRSLAGCVPSHVAGTPRGLP